MEKSKNTQDSPKCRDQFQKTSLQRCRWWQPSGEQKSWSKSHFDRGCCQGAAWWQADILGVGRVHHTQPHLPTPVSQHSEKTDGEVSCWRMRHCYHNKCQVGQWTPCGRHVVDGIHIGSIMHTSRAVNALWSTCSRRRSHRSDNA